MMKAVVVQFEVTGRDAAGLQRFYADLFGWPLRNTPGGQTGDYMRTSAGDTGLPGAVGPTRSGPNAAREPGGDGGPGQLTMYVEVDDIEEAVAQAERLGGTTVSPVHEVRGKDLRLAFIADPEGRVIGLSQGLETALAHAGYTH